MQAKVKDNFRWKTVVAFSGHEYIKGEWRPVPPGLEEKAKEHPFLDVREAVPAPAEKPVKVHEPAEPTAEAKLKEMVASQPTEIPVEAEAPKEKKAKPAKSADKE